ncbi:DDE superfamily endonuclease [Streptomyces sp. 2231.1]|uniref:alpha/beta fold hydrolase n=1 Tax=Streptomyces sp. 2231.1 TaxID=1855347 RepID=UPI00089BC756|nr:alpha/beta fold hydrolase [Streptomyces sp. 2231.1]SEE72016.1 DDE superfamily endonuclease [Streptomyces sp. 2231.1]
MSEWDFIALIDSAHHLVKAPIVLVWDRLNTHASRRMRDLIDERAWLTVFLLPASSPDLNPAEWVCAHLKRSLANLAVMALDRLEALVRNRLQYRPHTLNGFITGTGLTPTSSSQIDTPPFGDCRSIITPSSRSHHMADVKIRFTTLINTGLSVSTKGRIMGFTRRKGGFGLPRAAAHGAIALGVLTSAAAATPAYASDSDTPQELKSFYGQSISWKACEADREAQCASISVPLDYKNPRSEKISVTFSRLKATGKRRGVLFYNPGGPGGSGLKIPDNIRNSSLRGAYDLIGFDPRGTGISTPLYAPLDWAMATQPDIGPRPQVDGPGNVFDKQTAWAKEYMARIVKKNGGAERVKYFSTSNTARDMDVIRGVLHEENINYLGFSYGTFLGARYGTLFPAHLDRSVLDSAVSPTGMDQAYGELKSKDGRDTVAEWAAWVGDRDKAFHLGKSRDEVLETVEEISQKREQEGQPPFDGTLILGAHDISKWGDLARMVKDPEAHFKGADKSATGGESEEWQVRNNEIVRAEGQWSSDVESYRTKARNLLNKREYGWDMTPYMPAAQAFRGFTPPEPPRIKKRSYPMKGLVVQASRDNRTPYQGGRDMAKALDDILITVKNAPDHEQYLSTDNEAVDKPVTDYLLNGTLPSGNLVVDGKKSYPNVPADRWRA